MPIKQVREYSLTFFAVYYYPGSFPFIISSVGMVLFSRQRYLGNTHRQGRVFPDGHKKLRFLS